MSPRSQRASARGVSLIELICCIVIVAILAALAGPALLDTSAFQQRGYVNDVAAALRYAQKVAVSSGCDVQFSLNVVGAYQARQRAAAGATCAPSGAFTTPVLLGDGTSLSGAPPANVAPFPSTTVTFQGQGGLVGAGAPVTLSAGTLSITVDAGSGLVTVP